MLDESPTAPLVIRIATTEDIQLARNEQKLDAVDLHVWEHNYSAINLYESLGFELQHRELYYRLPL